jgi:hypothetical protein
LFIACVRIFQIAEQKQKAAGSKKNAKNDNQSSGGNKRAAKGQGGGASSKVRPLSLLSLLSLFVWAVVGWWIIDWIALHVVVLFAGSVAEEDRRAGEGMQEPFVFSSMIQRGDSHHRSNSCRRTTKYA